MKRMLSVLLCAAIIILPPGQQLTACAADDGLSVSARCAIVMCADNGDVLFEKDADRRCAIASITKIMTAILALESAGANNREIRFTKEMMAEGSSLSLKPGDIILLSELVRGMMALSGNDAANAIAISLGGSFEGFADMMNEKARQLGMNNTHFVTPSGLDDEQHYSSARDMAVLCCYAMENEDFRDAVSQRSIEISYVYPQGKKQQCINHNRLLSEYPGCIGIKTGFTKKAGRTLTTCAVRDGITLVAVTLNDGNDWNDHKMLLDNGFSQYKQCTVVTSRQEWVMPVVGGNDDTVTVHAVQDVLVPVRKNDSSRIKKRIYLPHFLYAPVEENRAVGEAEVFAGSRSVARVKLVAGKNVSRSDS